MIRTTPRPKARVEVTFVLPDEVGPASVVGDFNDWDPYAHPMRTRSNGTRSASVEVPQGSELRFRYLLDDGDWRDEPEGQLVESRDGTMVSSITV